MGLALRQSRSFSPGSTGADANAEKLKKVELNLYPTCPIMVVLLCWSNNIIAFVLFMGGVLPDMVGTYYQNLVILIVFTLV